MDQQRITAIALEHMGQRKTDYREAGYVFHHGRRTAQIALHLADRVRGAVDRDVLYAGALFHDVGKGDRPHNEAGALVARSLLEGACTPSEVAQICQIVRQHCLRKLPNDYSLATRLVQDADLLDHVGPMWIWYHVSWNALNGRTIDDALAYVYSEAHTLQRAEPLLNLDASIAMYDERVAFERSFIAEFERVHRQGV